MRRRVAVLSVLAAAAAVPLAAPASASCQTVVNRAGVVVATCAAPGGDVSVLVCVRGTCT